MKKTSEKCHCVTFDGVYMDSRVYVNGQLVGHYPNGYNQFSYYYQTTHKDGRRTWLLSMQLTNNQVAVGTQAVSTAMWPASDR